MHAPLASKVAFRSQHSQEDSKKFAPKPGEKDPCAELDLWWKDFPESKSGEEVTIEGQKYVQIGRCPAGKWTDVEIPPLFRVRVPDEVQTLYDHLGNAKKLGDGPLGTAYDEEGIPVPDWEIEDATKDVEGRDVLDANGRRRGGYMIKGVVKMKDYVTDVRRCYPQWGKRFGRVMKNQVGYVGTYTCAEAKLCLATEDFGFKLGEDAPLAPTPPLVRLCYGEKLGECDSIRIFVGLSEIHLEHHEEIKDVHYTLQALGYVCYNPQVFEEDRYWGEGIDGYPNKVYGGDHGGKGATFYSWYYRLPPFVTGLYLEGENGDPVDGAVAKLRQKKQDRLSDELQALSLERLAALKRRVADEQTRPWYENYFKTDSEPASANEKE